MAGWCYVLTNEAFPHLVKIGSTDRDVYTRASELSNNTGVPHQYLVAYAVRVENGEHLEKLTHRSLNDKRYKANREFFQVSVAEAILAVRGEIDRHKLSVFEENDAAKKAKEAKVLLVKLKHIELHKQEIRKISLKHKNHINLRMASLASPPVKNKSKNFSEWIDSISSLLGIVIFGGLAILWIINWPPAVIFVAGVAWWGWQDEKKTKETSRIRSPAYISLVQNLQRIDEITELYISNAHISVDRPLATIDKLESELSNLSGHGYKIPTSMPATSNVIPQTHVVEKKKHSSTSITAKNNGDLRWQKTDEGIKDLRTGRLIPNASLVFVKERDYCGYQVKERSHGVAWINQNDVMNK
jgi:hypothetical protein